MNTPAPWPGWTGIRYLGHHLDHRGTDRESGRTTRKPTTKGKVS